MTETDSSPIAAANTGDPAVKAFNTSILVSAVRCTLTYVVFPWLLPGLGLASGVGPGLGLAIGAIAIVFNVLSIRRFWRSRHPWRWPITVLNTSVIALLVVLVARDIADL
jgi:hypothetical protein